MDPWFIAQCMARLPRLTYFSHPESSLDDFFSEEENTITDGNHQGGHSISVQQGTAPHELEFLRSLSQSLGIHPPMANGRVAEVDPCHYRGRVVSRGHFPDSADQHLSAIGGECATSQLLRSLSCHCSSTDPSEMPTSSSGQASVSISPLPSPSANMQAPVMTSSAQHVVSCTDLYRPKSARPRVTTDVSHTSPRYRCNWEVAESQPCGKWIEGGSKEVWLHVRKAHGLKGLYSDWSHCRWGGCMEKLKGSSLQRHLAKHLDIRWRCSNCDVVFARYDYVRRHIKFSEECHGAEVVAHLASEQTSGTS